MQVETLGEEVRAERISLEKLPREQNGSLRRGSSGGSFLTLGTDPGEVEPNQRGGAGRILKRKINGRGIVEQNREIPLIVGNHGEAARSSAIREVPKRTWQCGTPGTSGGASWHRSSGFGNSRSERYM
jgi:hypothetical protein